MNKNIFIPVGIFLIIITLGVGVLWGIRTFRVTESQIQQSQQQILQINHLIHHRNELEGKYLYDILSVEKNLFLGICSTSHLTKPFMVIIIKKIDCNPCYAAEADSLRDCIQQGFPVVAMTYNEFDFILRDFRDRATMFPPQLVEKFVNNIHDNTILLCVLPSGLIVYADIPEAYKGNNKQQRDFYIRSRLLIQDYRPIL